MNEREILDVLIIGSGPAGLSAAIYSKRSNLKTIIVEKEYMGTGQIAESNRVDNYPGFYGISGFDLGDKLRDHAEKLDVDFLEDEVTEIEEKYALENDANKSKHFSVKLKKGEDILTRTIIYAAGATPKVAQIKGIEQFAGRGVSYCALCDGAFYKDKNVAVLGGGDTALDDALYLADICKKVYLIHRRDSFRGSDSTVERLKKKDNVEILLSTEVNEVKGITKLETIVLTNGAEKEIDGIFVAFGSIPNSKVVAELLDTDELGYILAREDGITSCNGLFVAGDVRTKSLRQVVTAVADGANASTSAYKYLETI